MKAQLPALLLDYRIEPKPTNKQTKTNPKKKQPINLSSTFFTFLAMSSGAIQLTGCVDYSFSLGQDTANQRHAAPLWFSHWHLPPFKKP